VKDSVPGRSGRGLVGRAAARSNSYHVPMRFLALEQSAAGATWPDSAATETLLREEARRAWELHQAGVIREISFRTDRHDVVIVLECDDEPAARASLATLPLVRDGLITFEIVGLRPYDGWARLFAPEPAAR
jgi:hypothetical protein